MKFLINEFELEPGDEPAVRHIGPNVAVLDIGPLSLLMRDDDAPLASKIAAVVAAHRAGEAHLLDVLEECHDAICAHLDMHDEGDAPAIIAQMEAAEKAAAAILDAEHPGSAILAAGGLTAEAK